MLDTSRPMTSDQTKDSPMPKVLPPIEKLRKLLTYDPVAGEVSWAESGKRFGSATDRGYIRGFIEKQPFYAHRIAWLLHYGTPPDGTMDHINGVRSDNRIVNLRDVTGPENQRNARKRSDNKSGYSGVRWCSKHSRWRVEIRLGGRQINVGSFVALDDAITARKAAEVGYGFTERHGS